ncbi:MAG: sulfotransferase family protein [Hyphomonas sp.]|nr:sulfotransferase family protein [Hyphomonas sp.]
MALKVIGAGFGRTGTLSMKAALERLGYVKCHHMMEVFPSPDQVRMWDEIGQGKDPGWDTVFEGFEASVDFPSSSYWRELADYYPEAKVILTTRSFESWYKSASETIYPSSAKIPGWMKALVPKVKTITRMVDNTVWGRVFHGRFEDYEYARKVFEEHEAAVKATIPSERLLVFEPKQGWEPLCAFLGKDVPDEPFPRVNDTAEFKKRIAQMKRLEAVPFVLGAAVLAAVLILLLLFQSP